MINYVPEFDNGEARCRNSVRTMLAAMRMLFKRTSGVLVGALILQTVSCTSSPAPSDKAQDGKVGPRSPDGSALEGSQSELATYIRQNYQKREVQIPMRDGIKLHTAIYQPRDRQQRYPILFVRSPYSCRPYGEDQYPSRLGPTDSFARDGYIFVQQDVRGSHNSEGEFLDMRPHLAQKSGKESVDESSDTYDSIEWLLANVDGHNRRVGMWGLSYRGFYAAAGMIDAHPALKAVVPSAPIGDLYFDDFHHHGAFFLAHAFNFLAGFGPPRPEPTTKRQWQRFDHQTPDGYQFFLQLGPLANVNQRYFHQKISLWNDLVEHPNYDAYWQARNILPHLKNVAPAVMTVGGWFDAEDLYGPLNVYRSVEQHNPKVFNILVMGPWRHGGWYKEDGDRLGSIEFESKTSEFFRQQVERPFFRFHLKGEGKVELPEATMFETGTNRWRKFARWPPAALKSRQLYLRAAGTLSFEPPIAAETPFDEYLSDPQHPVPFTEVIATGMTENKWWPINASRVAGRTWPRIRLNRSPRISPWPDRSKPNYGSPPRRRRRISSSS